MKKTTSVCLITLLFVLFGASAGLAATVTETFDSYANGTVITNIGGSGVWTIGQNTVVSGGGVNGTAGLSNASPIFNWKAQPFQWSTLAIGTKVAMALDFQTSATGKFDDDRVGWTIDANNSGSTTHQLALQLDNTSEGGMVVYWNSTRTLLNALSGIQNSTWYRFNVEFTKLGVTNAMIVGTLTQLDASGNPTGTPYVGTVTNTATFANKPDPARFTSTSQWPSFKNYNATSGNADNATFTIPALYRSYTGAPITENFDGLGTSGTNMAVLTGWNAGYFTPAIQQGTTGGSGTNIVPSALVVDNGSHDPNTTPMLANFGTTGAADRALGSFARTTPAGDQFLQLAIKNDSASPITSFVLAYTGEEWRNCHATVQQLTVWYSATSATSGFVSMGPSFNFSSPNNTGANVAIDGNDPTNRTVISATYTPATPIAAGSTFYIRWYDINDNGIADDYLAIDDLTVTPGSDATVSITSPTNGSTVIGDWVAIAATATPSGGASVTNVEFYAGATKIGEDATAPYTMNWCAVAPGAYSLTAVVLDDLGASATSSVVSVTLSAPAADGSLQFDGNDDYVTFGPAPELGLATFTIECWFKRTGGGRGTTTGTGGITDAMPLVTKGRGEAEASNVDMNWFLGIATNANVIAADFEEGAGGASPGLNHPVYGNTTLANGVWYHAAATYDGASWTLYLNGNVETNVAVNQPPRSDSIQHAALASAQTSTGTAQGNFQGLLDEVRVWNHARTAQEIADNYDSQIANQTGLVARWSLNEAVGLAARNATCGGVNGDLKNGPVWSSDNFLAPSVGITSPVNNAVLSGKTITIEATASDADGSVTNIQFFNGNTLLGEDATAPYSFVWTGVAAGAYALKAVASVDDGLFATSTVVNVTMTLVAPSVSITSPVNNDTISATTVTIEATASDTDGSVTNVQFYSGNTLLGDDTTEPYSFAWNDVVPGAYVLKAVATDDDGLSKTSAVVNVTVTPPPGVGGLYFDGQNDYVTFGAAPTLGVTNFTIECWFKRTGTGAITSTGTGGVTNGVPLVAKGRGEADGNNKDCNWFLGISTNGNVLAADFEDRNSGLNHPVLGATPVSLNVWQHAAVTYEQNGVNGTWVLYLNGVPDKTNTFSGANALVATPRGDSIQHAALASALTSTGAAAGYFAGVMDEVRVWNTNRTALQIADNYDRQITSEVGLIARWTLDDATGTAATNSISGGVNGTLINGPFWTAGYPLLPAANTAPTVAITSPTNGATVFTSFSIEANATDDGTVTNVDFYADGNTLLGSDTSSPYSYDWSGASEGAHALTAVAWDDAGLSATSTVVNVTVSTNLPPSAPVVVAPSNNAVGVATNATLTVSVSDPNADPMTVVFYGRSLAAAPGEDFTLVALPDTQFYHSSMNGGSPAIATNQIQWIVNNRVARNIRYLAQLGDCVQNGDNSGNDVEWRNATNTFYRLEDPLTTLLPEGVPYGVAVGNHDQSPIASATGTTTFYNQYFGTNHFQGFNYYGDYYGANNDNHYDLFSASGMDFIVLYFEYDATMTTGSPVLAWANSVLATNQNRRAIVASHWIINAGFNATFSAQGQAIYDSLKGNTNLFLMLCGHVSPEEGQRTDTYQGRTVWSVMTDYQSLTAGGNGWLRLYEFSPSNNVIHATTYSPWLNQSKTASSNQFDIPYAMTTTNPFVVIGSSTGVPSGSSASIVWTNLALGTAYEWYAVASDASLPTTGATNQFTTRPPLTVTLGMTGSPMAEAAGEATVTATLSETNADVVTVNLAFAGTATLTDDYTRSGDSISIPAGDLTGSITLTAVQDTVYEIPAETIVVDIDTVVNATESGTQQVTATITDDDPVPPSVTLSLTGNPMAEAAGQATVTATLSETSANDVTVNLAFAGTATLTTDYTRSGASISIPAGILAGSITLTAVPDSVYESPAETIVVDISTVINALEIGTQQVTATITDDSASAEFTAYNDCSKGAGVNPANTSEYPSNGATPSGLLKDFTTGATLPVTLSIVTNLVTYDGTGGPMPNSGTDAYDTFNGKVVFDNVVWYTTASNGFWMDAVFTGLDPAKEYEFATSVNRGGTTSDYWNRFSKFTISDVDSADNASTPGVTVNSATSVTFCSGSNSVSGYVARWTKIKSGADGDFTVRVEDGGGVGKGYAFDGIMLRETVPQPPTISLTSPTNNATLSTNFTITATAEDSDGTVTNVFFYDGSTLLGNDDTGPTYSYAWNSAPVGSHTLTAVAWDNSGLAATSAVVNVTVKQTQYVIVISVDGMGSAYITPLLTNGLLNELTSFKRFQAEGSGTLNARTDYNYAITLPNHVCMMTCRGVNGASGHNWTSNGDPSPTDTIALNKGSYVASGFDVAHDNGLRTGIWAGKSKFSLFQQSYSATSGAPDTTGPDNGQDKIDYDKVQASIAAATLTDDFTNQMAASPFHFVFFHYHEPDTAGHSSGWSTDPTSIYAASLKAVDTQIGKIMQMVENSPTLQGKTAIILTTDHGGHGTTHGDMSNPLDYTIPFYVWGPGVTAGGDLYAMNLASRTSPGTTNAPYTGGQPVRNGDAANLALDLLDLGAVPGSTIDSAQDLLVTVIPITVTADSGQSKVFGDADPIFTYVCSDPGVTFSGALSRVAGENVGDYAITQGTLSAGDNYIITFVSADFSIIKATPSATLAVNNSPVTYDGTAKAATVGITVSSVPGAVANILTGGAASQTAAGTYAVTADFVPTDTANYNTLVGLAAGDFVIEKATPSATLAVNNTPMTYDGTAKAATVGITVSSVPGAVANILTGGAVSQTAAGTYAVTADFVPTDTANYNTLTGLAAGDFVIEKATPTATLAVNNSPMTYDGTGKAATVGITVSSVPGAVANILTGGAASQTGAGTYAVTADFVPTDTANYNTLTGLAAGDFVIEKASSTTAISSSLNPSAVGSNVTFTITVGPVAPATTTPTGNVQFLTNDVAIGDPVSLVAGVAALDTALLPPGTNTVTANFLGDGNYLPSSDSLPQVVTVIAETPSLLGIVNNGDGSVTMTFAGTPGAEYLVLAGTDLSSPGSWVSVSTNTAGPSGQWTYTDNAITSYAQRFFRAAKP